MKMTKEARATIPATKRNEELKPKAVTNFMYGISYTVNPLTALQIITASSIFGEPQYYNDGGKAPKSCPKFEIDDTFKNYIIDTVEAYKGKTTVEIMEDAIDKALAYNFEATLRWAVTLRSDFMMRLNPQIIMVRAAMHPDRAKFTDTHKGLFNELNLKVMFRADDVISQITYYLFKTGSKNKIPGILKNSWTKRVNKMTRYELYKYRNHGLGLINAIRICHANNADIDELMRTGTLKMPPEDLTWETLRATNKTWFEIINTIKMNHMALLRNLRGIFTEITEDEIRDSLLKQLEDTVANGKQFPFRYMSARNAIKNSDIDDKTRITDSLEYCMDAACENLPRLKGNNAFLSDNSGSAWGSFNSEYGTVTIAEIGNLSSVIGAANSDKGTVFCFGDKLVKHEISKRDGIMSQTEKINALRGHDVGHSTENGIWLFFEDAIFNNIKYDNIFIYSDMQAGHGGLYGIDIQMSRCRDLNCTLSSRSTYIDVAKLVQLYREQVNPKVNVFCIQTAGYNNVLVPENGYRTAILTGWTGKELVYAKAINDIWDKYDLEND